MMLSRAKCSFTFKFGVGVYQALRYLEDVWHLAEGKGTIEAALEEHVSNLMNTLRI